MTVICGLDIANYMGVSWLPLGTPPSKWRCLTVEAEDEAFQEAIAADLVRGLRLVFGAYGNPDFVAVESPIRNVLPKRPGQLALNTSAGAVTSALDQWNIPWGVVPIQTWRVTAYGKGVKPTGDDDWKDLAIRFAEQAKIILPDTKRAARDAAEAIGVARAWQKCQVPSWHRDAFMALLQHRKPVDLKVNAMAAVVSGDWELPL